MKSLLLFGLVILVLSVGVLTSEVEASEVRLHMIPPTSIISLMNSGPVVTWGSDGGWPWLTRILQKYFSRTWEPTTRGSVPIPGTLLLFGGGFAGLMVWRARHPRS